jgi:hypothetical protein
LIFFPFRQEAKNNPKGEKLILFFDKDNFRPSLSNHYLLF